MLNLGGQILSKLPERTAAFEIFEYSDPLEFQSALRSVHTNITPLTNTIDVEQAVLHLPGCQVYHLKTFPRIVEGLVAAGFTMVGFTMDDNATIYFNGWKKDLPSITIGHGGSAYTMLEEGVTNFGVVLFEPEVTDRNWPQTRTSAVSVITTAEAEQRLRNLLISAFELAQKSPDKLAASAAELRDSFLAAIDQAVGAADHREIARVSERNSHFDLILKIDAYLADHITEPVYSDEIAKNIGVSVRTLYQVVVKYRGMSPHRYLRLKRLWSVRKQLLAGGLSVKASALAHGFRHMGDFSRLYQVQFGETPSQTLSRK